MSFLGGIDLGTPADRQAQVLRRDLELRRDTWAGPPSGPGKGLTHPYYFRGGADMCLRHGKFRPGRELPDEYTDVWKLKGDGMCFYNALAACQRDPALRYCEGYCNVGRGNQITHAWCIAPDDGVVDVTYPHHMPEGVFYTQSLPTLPVLPPRTWGYWGVIFPLALVEFHDTEPLHLPFFDRPRAEELEMRSSGKWTDEDIAPEHDHPILKVPYNPERTTL